MTAKGAHIPVRGPDGRIVTNLPGAQDRAVASARTAALAGTVPVTERLRSYLLDEYGTVRPEEVANTEMRVNSCDDTPDDVSDAWDGDFRMEVFESPVLAYGQCGMAAGVFEIVGAHDESWKAMRHWEFVDDNAGVQHHATVVTVDDGNGGTVDMVVDWTWAQWRVEEWSLSTDDSVPFPLVLPLAEYGALFHRVVAEPMCEPSVWNRWAAAGIRRG